MVQKVFHRVINRIRTKTSQACLNFPSPCKQSWSFNLRPLPVSPQSIQCLSPYGRCRSNEDMVSHSVPLKWTGGVEGAQARVGLELGWAWGLPRSWRLMREWLPLSNTWPNPRLLDFFKGGLGLIGETRVLDHYATELTWFCCFFLNMCSFLHIAWSVGCCNLNLYLGL